MHGKHPRLGHTFVFCADIAAFSRFWVEGLGFTVKTTDEDNGYAELTDASGRVLALVTPACYTRYVGLPVHLPEETNIQQWQQPLAFSVEVSDIVGTLKTLEAFDVDLMKPPTLMPWGDTIAFVREPRSGLAFELCQKKK